MARQGPRQRNKQAKTKKQTDKTQDKKARKTRKVHTQKSTHSKILLLQKSTHSKSCGFRPKSRKAASLQTADGFIFYMSTYDFYTSGHFDTCVKMKITRVEMTTKKEQAVQM